ncbi:MAG: response regulator [Micromonosporaceae bacterium]|nr:response regulator [Micromonosporaceae bacterium]
MTTGLGEPLAKALLVDDRRDNLIALEAILQGLPVEPVAVQSGEAALKQLLIGDFAVILLDAQMPEMDGFETANHIKQRERTRHVPIIFLTAADRDAQLALRGYAAGAVDYLTKPFDPWVLRAKVSIFVDLWTKSRQMDSQAETVRNYRRLVAAVDDALPLLRSGGSVEEAVELLERARARSVASPPLATGPVVTGSAVVSGSSVPGAGR